MMFKLNAVQDDELMCNVAGEATQESTNVQEDQPNNSSKRV